MTFTANPRMIADTRQFDLAEASELARLALKKDAHFDEQLVEFVKQNSGGTPEQMIRILDVLQNVCPDQRLFRHLCGFKSTEPRVRSKVALIMGRLVHDTDWLRWQLADSEPRVRANAVEGWRGWSAEARSVLLEASRDPHHRVAANAALSLHTVGDPAGGALLFSMLRHTDEMFRRAALWAIGVSRDGRFTAAVAGIAERAAGEEKAAADKVLARLRKLTAVEQFFSVRKVRIGQLQSHADGQRMIRVHCFVGGSAKWLAPPQLSARDFIVTEGGKPVEEYSFHWPAVREALNLAIVTPASAAVYPDLLHSLQLVNQQDESVALLSYAEEETVPASQADDPAQVHFWTEAELSALRASPANTQTIAPQTIGLARWNLDQAVAAGVEALRARPGNRHLFVVAGPSLTSGVHPQTRAIAQDSNAVVHAIVSSQTNSTAADSIRLLAAGTAGGLAIAETTAPLADFFANVRAAHFGSCEISWHSRAREAEPVEIACGGSHAECLPAGQF
jgi:HEAT repeats